MAYRRFFPLLLIFPSERRLQLRVCSKLVGPARHANSIAERPRQVSGHHRRGTATPGCGSGCGLGYGLINPTATGTSACATHPQETKVFPGSANLRIGAVALMFVLALPLPLTLP